MAWFPALGALLGLCLHAAGAAAPAAPATAGADQASLNRAAALYHQARFDSSRARLESLLAKPGWRRRDSLMLYQYLGMTASRLGEDSSAVAGFGVLLSLDSLFQFPRNEDPGILRNFQAARDRRAAGIPAPAALPGPDPAAGAAVASGTTAAAGAASGANAPEGDGPGGSGGMAVVAAMREQAYPGDPLRAHSTASAPRRMNLALGAVPLGGGWLVRGKTTHALTLGLLQGGGMLLSLYASEQQTAARRDGRGLEEGREEDIMVRWQWVQAVSLSTALGAYLFSIFASGGD